MRGFRRKGRLRRSHDAPRSIAQTSTAARAPSLLAHSLWVPVDGQNIVSHIILPSLGVDQPRHFLVCFVVYWHLPIHLRFQSTIHHPPMSIWTPMIEKKNKLHLWWIVSRASMRDNYSVNPPGHTFHKSLCVTTSSRRRLVVILHRCPNTYWWIVYTA